MMRVARLSGALAAAALIAGAGGDRARPAADFAVPGSAGITRAEDPARRIAAAALPRFALFGWVSPPVESTTAERYRELAGAGLNVAVPAWHDSGRTEENLRRFRLAAASGVRCLAWDRRFEPYYLGKEVTPALLDSITSDYRNEPGFLGYYFTDEPAPAEFPLLGRIYADLRAHDPAHPAWNNLLGISAFPDRAAWERYVRDFLDTTKASVLCAAMYDFLRDRDRGLFVENVAGLRALANEYGIPFWCIVLLVEHGTFRGITEGELRWQVAHVLAYGGRGVGYFTYWTPAPDPKWNWQPAVIAWDGTRTPWYGMLAAFNPRVRAAGETLADLAWLSTQHAGSVPRGGAPFVADPRLAGVEGRAAIGRFAGADGALHLLVANSDSLGARVIPLTLPGARRVWSLGPAPGSWTEVATREDEGGLRVEVALAAGDFALLRVEAGAEAALGPALRPGPNPARGEVRLALARVSAGARIEIVDGAGRRVWSRAVAPGAASVSWNGERERGGRAPAGIYLARLTDANGSATARISWLGAR